MKKATIGILDALHALALAVWLGGLSVLGAVVSPMLFRGATLTEMQAERAFGAILLRFTPVAEVCGILMFASQFLLRRRFQKQQNLFVLDGIRQLLTFGALLLAEICFRNLLPNLDTTRRIGELAHFERLHGIYSGLAIAQVSVLALIVCCTAWLHLPNATGGASRHSAPADSPAPARKRRTRRRPSS